MPKKIILLLVRINLQVILFLQGNKKRKWIRRIDTAKKIKKRKFIPYLRVLRALRGEKFLIIKN
jgi:hypothetical protein